MQKKGFCIVMVLGLALSAFGWRSDEMEIKVYLENSEQARRLGALNLRGDIHLSAGFARLYVTATEKDEIGKLGLSYEILIEDLNDYYRHDFYNENRNSLTADQIIAAMNAMASKYPTLCTKHEFGKSVKGKTLMAIKISDNAGKDENEAEVLFDGGIHGDETGGPDLIVREAQYLLDNYGKDQKITDLVNNREIWCYCMVNPDGRPNSRENANGVDLNRNYGYMTGNGFSEVETRALRNCLLLNQFSIEISYHQGIEYLLFPWCFKGEATPDKAIHSFLANLYSTSSNYYSPSKNVQSYYDYATTGETIDYAYGAMGVASLTMEISTNKGSINDKYYTANQPAMRKMMEYAGYGLEGMVTGAATAAPVGAVLFINDFFPIYADPEVGDYHKFVPEGSYTIKVIANGYKPQTITGISVLKEKSTVTDIKMERDGAAKVFYGYRVVFAEKGTGKTPDLLGPPDAKTFSGNVVIDMQYPIKDISGNEIKVTVNSGNAVCSAGETIDGPFKSLGSGTEFDLSKAGLSGARYLKFTGGAAIDAVEATGDIATPIGSGTAPGNAGPAYTISISGNVVSVHLKGRTPYRVDLYNIQGRRCCGIARAAAGGTFQSRTLSRGIYILSLASERETITGPIVIHR